jgi:hypothetical protein
MKLPKSLLATLEGLLWAAVGGGATSLLEIQQYMTNWKDFDIDYAHVAHLFLAGAVLGGAAYLRDLAQRQNVATANAAVLAATGGVPIAKPP